MDTITLSDLSEVYPDTTPGDDPNTIYCDTCGNGFVHSGRGRKPKKCPDCRTVTAPKTSGTRRSNKDVDTALAVLESTYSAAALGLMVVSPRAASTWVESADRLQQSNRAILVGDPNLVKSICRAGEKSGKTMFFVTHLIALAPVVGVLRQEWSESRKDRPRKTVQRRRAEAERERVEEARVEGTGDIPNRGFFE